MSTKKQTAGAKVVGRRASNNPKAPQTTADPVSSPAGSPQTFYQTLRDRFGRQHWWPGDTAFEIVIGAILTQNTSWTNVEKAIGNLKSAGALSAEAMKRLAEPELALLIRPSGYYRQKARKLKAFLHYLRRRHDGSLEHMFRLPTAQLREELLAVHGIGEETADSILLYGGGHAVFVVDTYTRRILARHNLIAESWSYGQIQTLFHDEIQPNAAVYNEFHALLVETGKRHCLKAAPQCEGCPLESFPHRAG